ncbi:MAG: hypothetical protein MUC67_05785 [Acidobacteria bacterium]|jgi:hypothetical protein|nr:hypothetical protein [Acidobacteriota bacterium]
MYDVLEQSRRLSKLFRESFRVGSICEALLSFDVQTSCRAVRHELGRRRFRTAGVRDGGLVVGSLALSDLPAKPVPCGPFRRPFAPEELVPDDLPLADALPRLAGRDQLFVTAFGGVTGIVTWSDLQRPPVRMWLFGLVTLVEMIFGGLAETFHAGDDWQELVSPGRLQRAREIQRERQRMNPGAEALLFDCLQFAEKGRILLRREDTRRYLGWESKESGERALRRLGHLRDNLAHAQDIVTDDWPVVLALAARLDDIVGMGSAFARPRRARPRPGASRRGPGPGSPLPLRT